MPRYAQALLDGVTYLAGHREPVARLFEVEPDCEPSPAMAEAALRAVLGELEGLDARLRAGFASVRFFERPPGAWLGPARLFSFEARVAGAFEVTYAGEDPSTGGDPPPSIPGGD